MRSQDAVFLISSVASNPGETGRRLAWDFLKSNWASMHKRFGGGAYMYSLILLKSPVHVCNVSIFYQAIFFGQALFQLRRSTTVPRRLPLTFSRFLPLAVATLLVVPSVRFSKALRLFAQQLGALQFSVTTLLSVFLAPSIR